MSAMRTRHFAPELAIDDVARPASMVMALAAIALLVMPLFTTFGELLTRLAIASGVDSALGGWIAPTEARLVHGLLSIFGYATDPEGQVLAISDGTHGVSLFISWNCVGWQTLLFFALSLPGGLQGQHTALSKAFVVGWGLFGIAVLNVLRIAVVGLVALHFGQLPSVIVHDFGSVIATVAFLMAFWALAYQRILEPKGGCT